MNTLYRELMVARIRYAVAAARAARTLEHAGVKGAIREVLIADLFRPLVSADIGVATGILISASDQAQSSQQDIILFDRRILPPILFEQGPAIIPVESALICIEIKSRLTAAELKAAHEGAKTVRGLDLQSGTRDKPGSSIDIEASGVCSLLLALETDLTEGGETEVQRYKKLIGEDQPTLSGICIVGRSSWWPTERLIFDKPSGKYLNNDGTVAGEWRTESWRKVPAGDDHAEIVELISDLNRLMQLIAVSRGQPSLAGYLK
jgi:hypothetical protein